MDSKLRVMDLRTLISVSFCLWSRVDSTSQAQINNIFVDYQQPLSTEVTDLLAGFDKRCRQKYCPRLDVRANIACQRAEENAYCVNSLTGSSSTFIQDTQLNSIECMKGSEESKLQMTMIGVTTLEVPYEEAFEKATRCGWYRAMQIQPSSEDLFVDAVTKLQAFCTTAYNIDTVDTTEEEDKINNCINGVWTKVKSTVIVKEVLSDWGWDPNSKPASTYKDMLDLVTTAHVMTKAYAQTGDKSDEVEQKFDRMDKLLPEMPSCLQQVGISITTTVPTTPASRFQNPNRQFGANPNPPYYANGPPAQPNAPGFPSNGVPGIPSNGAPGIPSNGVPGIPSNGAPGVPSNGAPFLPGPVGKREADENSTVLPTRRQGVPRPPPQPNNNYNAQPMNNNAPNAFNPAVPANNYPQQFIPSITIPSITISSISLARSIPRGSSNGKNGMYVEFSMDSYIKRKVEAIKCAYKASGPPSMPTMDDQKVNKYKANKADDDYERSDLSSFAKLIEFNWMIFICAVIGANLIMQKR